MPSWHSAIKRKNFYFAKILWVNFVPKFRPSWTNYRLHQIWWKVDKGYGKFTKTKVGIPTWEFYSDMHTIHFCCFLIEMLKPMVKSWNIRYNICIKCIGGWLWKMCNHI